MLQVYIVVNRLRYLDTKYIGVRAIVVESLYVVINLMICYGVVQEHNNYSKTNVNQIILSESTKTNRYLLVIMILILVFKGSYYLSLVESFSPLIDCIFKIVWGSKWFIFIILSVGFVFSFSFYFYGRNQVEFDFILA